jgi:RHS repeat-associated protein
LIPPSIGTPHAVRQTGSGASATFYYYDGRGNQTVRDAPGTANDRRIRYSVDDRPYEIAMGSGQRVRFWYGPDGQRYKRVEGGKTTLYLGGVEAVIQNGVTTFKRYLGGIALQTVANGGATGIKYLFHDHLGSLVRIANADGSVAEALDYAAFGERRSSASPFQAGGGSATTDRGFTGHEMLDGTDVIHRNGRIYDAQLGRIPAGRPGDPGPGQRPDWNAYTYVFNNPLAYTDPSGNISLRQALGSVGAVVGTVFAAAVREFWAKIGYAALIGGASDTSPTGTLQGPYGARSRRRRFAGVGAYFDSAGAGWVPSGGRQQWRVWRGVERGGLRCQGAGARHPPAA